MNELFSSAAEGQEMFNNKFPDGLLVTAALGEPEHALMDESPQMLATKVVVEFNEEDADLTLVIVDFETSRPFFVSVAGIEEVEGDLVVVSNSGRFFVLSGNISDSQRAAVKSRLEGGFFA